VNRPPHIACFFRGTRNKPEYVNIVRAMAKRKLMVYQDNFLNRPAADFEGAVDRYHIENRDSGEQNRLNAQIDEFSYFPMRAHSLKPDLPEKR
jgi:hypothetical protein